MKYFFKKQFKRLGIYNILCRVFLKKRKFIIEPFVYLNNKNEIVDDEITDKIRWLENFVIETQCIEFAENEFRNYAKNKYEYYDSIWLF